MRLFSNQAGSTIVQILLASAVILGAGGYMFRTTSTKGKFQKFAQNRDYAFQ
jgi:uncharacterized protein HemX